MTRIDISLNGKPHQIESGLTVDALLQQLELDPRKVAVERNLEITPRSDYGAVQIKAGDQLEIVHFVGGG